MLKNKSLFQTWQHCCFEANSILVERPQKHLFHTSVNLISMDIFFLCVFIHLNILWHDNHSAYNCKKEKKKKKNGGSELWCMIIWSEIPRLGNISSDCRVSPLCPSEHSWESGRSHVKVPETAVITVLKKGMKADRWRDTNRKQRWSSVCQTLQIRVQTLTGLRQKKREKKP